MTALLTPDLVGEAINLCEDQINHLIQHNGRGGGAIAIAWRGRDRDGDVSLGSRTFGKPVESWPRPFHEIAASKLKITLESGLPSAYVQNCAPQYLDVDDTPFWGSVILDNICVAFSGLPPEYDEAICQMMAGMIVALVKLRRKQLADGMPKEGSFLNQSKAA